MNQGKTYLVLELNISEKIALCRESNLKYYTKTRDYTDIHVIGGDMVSTIAFGSSAFCPLLHLFFYHTLYCLITTSYCQTRN